MRGSRSTTRRIDSIGLISCAAMLAATPAAQAKAHWAPAFHGAGRGPAGSGWNGLKGGYAKGWHGPSTFDPHAPAARNFSARNPAPFAHSFSSSGSVTPPNGHSATFNTTFNRTGYGDYTFDRSVTNAGGRAASLDTTQSFNPANGSYSRTVTGTGFNGTTASVTGTYSR
ncbi:MAG TPA: hypothetical protein VMF62_19990 [Acetobacteraceae bacterium]|jgi:hypothetical protein|nr:hypothetical protein [Acetobacteraceae bacterium]